MEMSRSARHSWQLKLLSTTFALPRYHMSAQGRGTKKGSVVSNGNSNEAAVIMKTGYSPNVDIAQRPAASFVNSPVAATQVGPLRRVMFRTVQKCWAASHATRWETVGMVGMPAC